MKKFFKLFALFLAALILAGCGTKQYYEKVQLIRNDDYQAASVRATLNSYGVRVAQVNGDILILIPNRLLFNENSANLSPYSHPILENVVKFLGYYDEEVIQVASYGYTNNVQHTRVMRALAEERAHQVIKYLISQDVSVSLIYAVGKVFPIPPANDIPTEYPGYLTLSFKKYYRY